MSYSNTTLIPYEGTSFTENEITAFNEQYLPVIKQYCDAVKQKKEFEKQEKKFKAQLGKVMDELGIKSMDSDFVRFTRIDAGQDKTTIDLDLLKSNEPELYAELIADYPKTVKGKSAYVKFDVK